MMLPLWTNVRLRRPCPSAYSTAARASRSVPSRETGFTPTPLVWGKRIFLTPISFWRNAISFFASALSAARLVDGRVEHGRRGAPDVGAGAVAFDERDDGTVGDVELAGAGRMDQIAGRDHDDGVGRHE